MRMGVVHAMALPTLIHLVRANWINPSQATRPSTRAVEPMAPTKSRCDPFCVAWAQSDKIYACSSLGCIGCDASNGCYDPPHAPPAPPAPPQWPPPLPPAVTPAPAPPQGPPRSPPPCLPPPFPPPLVPATYAPLLDMLRIGQPLPLELAGGLVIGCALLGRLLWKQRLLQKPRASIEASGRTCAYSNVVEVPSADEAPSAEGQRASQRSRADPRAKEQEARRHASKERLEPIKLPPAIVALHASLGRASLGQGQAGTMGTATDIGVGAGAESIVAI